MSRSDSRLPTPDPRPLRIWLINPYGPVPGEGWRDYRFTLVARALAARGHDVTWFTAAFAHQSKEQRERGWERREIAPRFAIELVPTPRYRRNISPGRLWFEYIFARRVRARGKTLPAPDVIVAADPPQFCGAAGRALARHHCAVLVIDCLDLWPELFVAAAPRALRWLVDAAVLPLRVLRRRNVRAASLAIAVADTYRLVIERDGARRSITIPIGVDVDALASPAVTRADDDALSLIYAGNLGEQYDLDTLLEAVDGMPHVKLTIAGRGPAEERLRKRAATMSNVTFAGVVDAAELPRLYAAADVGVAPYSAGSTVALPLKLFDYIAAGLPVITSLRGEAWQLLESIGDGIGYTPGNAASLRDAIRALEYPPRRCRMAMAARAAAERFDTKALYEHYADEIEALAR